MRYLVILYLILTIGSVSAQSQKQLVNYADVNFDAGDFYGASLYYKQALDLDSSKIEILYKYATALRLYNNYSLAAYYYAKVWDKDKGGRIYKDAAFWLADMQKYNADYRKSSKTWRKVKSKYRKNKKGYEYAKAQQEILSCNYASRIKNDSMPKVRVENIGGIINTTDSEFAASKCNNELKFSSLRAVSDDKNLALSDNDYKVKIYNSIQKESNWDNPSKESSVINVPNIHSANTTYDAKNQLLYFTKCDSINSCKIYVSKLNSNNQWEEPKELPERINANNKTTTQPNYTLIKDKEYLFFVSDRNGGKGKLDIWYAQILDANTFSKPINLEINSPDNEITPFYDTVGNALYFSSNWHLGKGGFDVFKSKGYPNELQEPENMLSPINTQWNDMYFVIYPENEEGIRDGFLTSNRVGSLYKKGPTCCNDIYTVKIIGEKQIAKQEEQNIVTLDDLNKYLPVTLYFHNDRPGPRTMDTTVDLNYLKSYDFYTSLHSRYKTVYSEGLKDEDQLNAKLDIDNLFKHYIDKGVSDLNLFTNLLLIELKKGQKIEITIKGFASPLAKTEYNVNLTKRRISSLINYLKDYNNGEFIPYLNNTAKDGGGLSFVKIPFGEYTASGFVSDNINDKRNSIYSKGAALERKIEIQSVTYAEKGTDYAELTVGSGTYDFGKTKQGETLKHDFILKNTGTKVLEIKELQVGCGCVKISIDKQTIPVGEQAIITMELDTKQLEGKQVKSATIIANSFPSTKRLVLTTEVFKK